MTCVPLNLHKKYAPNWGVWEVAREIYCNALDADPNGLSIDSSIPNELTIKTNSAPSLAEVIIIGCGTKAPGGDTIGQFGEGLKIAALAATRAGGEVILSGGSHRITFTFKPFLGEEVLHAHVSEQENASGFTATIKMLGAHSALDGRILKDGKHDYYMVATRNEPARLYCKGVYICDMPKTATYSYNLNSVTINRDRSLADSSDVNFQICKLFSDHPSIEFATTILEFPESLEATDVVTFLEYFISEPAKIAVKNAFHQIHGDRAVLIDDIEQIPIIRNLGLTPVFPNSRIRKLCAICKITLAADVIPKNKPVEDCDWNPEWDKYTEELFSLSRIVGVPASLRAFKDTHTDLMGVASVDDNTVYLNERLMADGQRDWRIRTYLHELAHIQSGAYDGTISFENALDLLMSKLALHLLDSKVAVPVTQEITTR